MRAGVMTMAERRTIWYLPLEPYKERYTEQLWHWTVSRWRARGLSVKQVTHFRDLQPTDIKHGQVLDAVRRSQFAMEQIQSLLDTWDQVGPDDVIYIDDFFHPGFEALPYVMHQTNKRPKIATRSWAQSFDVYDFTFPMLRWMRHYERMVEAVADLVFVASPAQIDHMRAAGWEGRVEVAGLPFDRDAVRAAAGLVSGTGAGPRAPSSYVVYSSRLDPEKQPGFLASVAERLYYSHGLTTVICSGASELRIPDSYHRKQIEDLIRRRVIQPELGLTKARYYEILSTAYAHLNTALQDYVSFTLLEASALGVPSVVPAFRSFIDEFAYDPRLTYRPWVVEDAVLLCATARSLFDTPEELDKMVRIPAQRHHNALDIMADALGRL